MLKRTREEVVDDGDDGGVRDEIDDVACVDSDKDEDEDEEDGDASDDDSDESTGESEQDEVDDFAGVDGELLALAMKIVKAKMELELNGLSADGEAVFEVTAKRALALAARGCRYANGRRPSLGSSCSGRPAPNRNLPTAAYATRRIWKPSHEVRFFPTALPTAHRPPVIRGHACARLPPSRRPSFPHHAFATRQIAPSHMHAGCIIAQRVVCSHEEWDWGHPSHIGAGTVPTPATCVGIAAVLGNIALMAHTGAAKATTSYPHLRRD